MISLKVNKANITIEQKEILTSQRVGLKVHFEFSKEWDELNKIIVCQSGKISRGTVLDENNNCIVPAKVLLNNGQDLLISVRGYNTSGDIVIPSIYANLGEIKLGSNITNLNFDSDTPPHELLEEIMLRLIPKGGSVNQVLTKKSNNDYEFKWEDNSNSKVYNSIAKLDDYLYEITYLNTDDNYAREYFLQEKPETNPGACSSFVHTCNTGKKFIRYFDWTYNNNVEFIVKTPARDGKYAIEGVAGGSLGITKDMVENEQYSSLYKILPYYMTDGHNEYGLVISTNVVPLQCGKTTGTHPLISTKDQICATMLVKYLLERCKTASEAVDLIRDYVSVYASSSLHNLDYEQHFLIADKEEVYCLEFINNEVVIQDTDAITNFFITTKVREDGYCNTPVSASEGGEKPSAQGITSHGSGLERYNIIKQAQSEHTYLEDLLPQLIYTNAYKYQRNENSDNTWYTEFVGEINGINLTVDSELSDFEPRLDVAINMYQNRTREDANTWQSMHISIYDFHNNNFEIYTQENLDKKFTIGFNYYSKDQIDNQNVALKNWVEEQGYITSAPVTSVNDKTGDVVLLGTDIKAYDKATESVTTVAMNAASNAETALTAARTIDLKIPPQASASNQLADKDFVNSSVNNIAAYYITKDADGTPFMSYKQLRSIVQVYSGGEERTPTKNDYTIVQGDESAGIEVDDWQEFTSQQQYIGYYVQDYRSPTELRNYTKTLVTAENVDILVQSTAVGKIQAYISGENPTTRYIYIPQESDTNYNPARWQFQYIVNNSGLTAAQLAALNSGITSEKVSEIDNKLPLSAGPDHPLTGDLYMSVGSNKRIRRLAKPESSYDAANKIYVDEEVAKKQGKLTAGEGITIDEDNTISATAVSSTKPDWNADEDDPAGILNKPVAYVDLSVEYAEACEEEYVSVPTFLTSYPNGAYFIDHDVYSSYLMKKDNVIYEETLDNLFSTRLTYKYVDDDWEVTEYLSVEENVFQLHDHVLSLQDKLYYDDNPVELASNKTDELTPQSTDEQYPTAKKVFEELYEKDKNYKFCLVGYPYDGETESYIAKYVGYNHNGTSNYLIWFDMNEDPVQQDAQLDFVPSIIQGTEGWSIKAVNDSSGNERYLGYSSQNAQYSFYKTSANNTIFNFRIFSVQTDLEATEALEVSECSSYDDIVYAYKQGYCIAIAHVVTAGDFVTYRLTSSMPKAQNNRAFNVISVDAADYDSIENAIASYDETWLMTHLVEYETVDYAEKYLHASENIITKSGKSKSGYIGKDNQLRGTENTLLIGNNLKTNKNNSLIIGQYNSSELPFVIGNGVAADKRSDAVTINGGGTATFSGSVNSKNDITCVNDDQHQNTEISLRDTKNRLDNIWHGQEDRFLITFGTDNPMVFNEGSFTTNCKIPRQIGCKLTFKIDFDQDKNIIEYTIDDISGDADVDIDSFSETLNGHLSYNWENEILAVDLYHKDGSYLEGNYYGNIRADYYIPIKAKSIHLVDDEVETYGGRIDFGNVDNSTGKGYCYIEETDEDNLTAYSEGDINLCASNQLNIYSYVFVRDNCEICFDVDNGDTIDIYGYYDETKNEPFQLTIGGADGEGRIAGVSTPEDAMDAANKLYVDNAILDALGDIESLLSEI